MVALAKGNEIRLARAALKREVKNGEMSIVDALEDKRAAAIEVGVLLCAQRHWGVGRTRKVLRPLGIGERQQVEDLTDQKRRALAYSAELHERERRERAGA
jgi:hypothetical protein